MQEINAGYGRKGEGDLAIFHFTVKIVGRSKGKSIIAASAYLNGDVMKNEETGRKIEEKYQSGQAVSASWKVEENRIIKKQNAILKKLQEVFGQVGILLKQWKERLNDIRRKQRSYSHDGEYVRDMGFSAVAIAERVGHESIDITYRYAHLFPSKQLDMVNKLENKNRMMEGYSDVTEEDMEIAKSSSVVSFQKYFSRIG